MSRPGVKPSRCCPSHSPTLRPWIARVAVALPDLDVLRGGVLEPGARRRPVNTQAKAAVNSTAPFTASEAREGLSLSSGASIRSHVFSSWASLLLSFARFASETTKATRWVALTRSWYAASGLARAPPGEGGVVTEPAIAGDRLQARRSIGDPGRFGLHGMAVRCDRHRRIGGMPRRNIVETPTRRKGQFTKSRCNCVRIARYFLRSTARSSAALFIFERPSIPSSFASL